LASNLIRLKHVYIVVDIELLTPETSSSLTEQRFTLSASISEPFSHLSRTSPSTVVKVMLVSCGSPLFAAISDADTRKHLLLAGKGNRSGRSRKGWHSGTRGFRGGDYGGASDLDCRPKPQSPSQGLAVMRVPNGVSLFGIIGSLSFQVPGWGP